ncbi:hypothetical protein ACJMK2_004398 [Sinanodonta woodiana]|uniref:DNA mismatch repair protein n=1 Tax=Sinanodonta woodiana TaxID=1069815 RepID=A0ABD3Y138_SINWO
MGPKSTPGKQKNTLFSYFNKSPAAQNSIKSETNGNDVLSPKRSPNNKKSPSSKNTPSKEETEFQLNDLVWAKLEGYPWWPSLVCNHPTENTHYKGGKTPQIHVQFFDQPPSRAWIKTRNIKPYQGSEDSNCMKGGPLYSTSPLVHKGMEEADKALKMSREDRSNLVVELKPSDDEDEEEEEEDMDFDPAIFDDEMDEEDSKENKDHKNGEAKTPERTSKKSPHKGKRRSERKTKRRKIMIEDSEDSGDSADEFKLESDEDEDLSSDDDVSSGVDEDKVSELDAESEMDSPVKLASSRKRKKPMPRASTAKKSLNDYAVEEKKENTSSTFTPKVGEKTKSKLAAFTADDSPITSAASEERDFPHTKLDFLRPEKIRDKAGNPMSNPDYDPKTLYLPDSFMKQQTPAMRQWWDMKSQHFDTILFFKMGKFYELFNMDAVVAVRELGLIYMKGEHAHSGFPEIAYNRYADTLIQKGYKVARIEQTETPDMMAERCKKLANPTKFDKVVKREICRITSCGTKTFNVMDGECGDSQSTYLLAVLEKLETAEGCPTYGVCFVDTSIGKFYIGQFSDDRHCSRLRTLIAHYTPVQVLHEKGKMSQKTSLMLSNNLTSCIKEPLVPGKEFWDSGKTLKVLAEEDYFKDEESKDFKWPDALKKMISEVDSLGLTAAEEYSLAISALGAITWYLQYSLMDKELLSMKNFEQYVPLDYAPANSPKKTTFDFSKKHMVLDGVTLKNLDVIENSSTGTLEGTLLERLDNCSTAFGKRLFRQWLCAPLCNPAAINDRLDAVDDLIGCKDLVAEVTELLKKLPDLERFLSRIHTLGVNKGPNHPDSRAILYEEVTYSKRKIEDFLSTIDGFKVANKIARKFKDRTENFKSKLLKKTVTLAGENADGYFPDLTEDLQFFENAFDHNKAKKDGVILPSKGVDKEYDKAVSDIKATEQALNDYLEQQRNRLACKSIVYWGTAKNRYQMEIPELAWKRVPDEYDLTSSKKGWKRYKTAEIEKLFAKMMDAEERKDASLKDVMRRIFHTFDERYKKWNATVQCLAVLDVLLSMAHNSHCGDGIMCRPEIICPSEETGPFLEVRDGRHPCVSKTFSGGDFIPNNTVIGIPDANAMETDEKGDNTEDCSRVVLVTGPNMGGKSTLMRQVGLITIMAQMGCYVPAEKCTLTPVDRVFTRLGASDRIMAGESTFYVELSETSAILQHATQHSLVLMDELGRGTATYDGTAIACSVVEELSQKIRCRTLFSTHYHSLVEEFSHDPNIRLGHMACMVESEEEDPTQETITFLYKFSKGACPKSYGFNAAKLANIPDSVIKVAVEKAKDFEESLDRLRIVRSLFKDSVSKNLEKIQHEIRVP